MAKAKVKKINHKDMLEKIREYKELKSSIDALKERQDEVKNEIISVMDAHSLDTYEVDVFKVTYKSYETNGFDKDKFKTDRPDLYEKYKKVTVSKRFNVA